ncbi:MULTISPECIES: PH domain-containing protein [Amycolatopsis]|uniref:PH domain-containing protein n=1 Tax=Amycolatopsis TaxID=1813 RepID=UPI001C589844|nr:PH domain-containing protein [Amycolatopsis sp. TNS106]
MESGRVTVRNWGYRCLGWLHVVIGVPIAVVSVPLTFAHLPESLFFLVLVPVFGCLAWYGAGLARARVVADESGLEIRGWRTVRVRWVEVVSIDAPEPGAPSARYDFTAAMARVLLTSGRSVPLAAVAAWLRPTFWRSGTPKKLAADLAILRAQHARHRPRR